MSPDKTSHSQGMLVLAVCHIMLLVHEVVKSNGRQNLSLGNVGERSDWACPSYACWFGRSQLLDVRVSTVRLTLIFVSSIFVKLLPKSAIVVRGVTCRLRMNRIQLELFEAGFIRVVQV